MKKAMLIGNGFTSCINLDYSNAPMMKKFYEREPELVDKIERLFDDIRYLNLNNSELLAVSEALFSSEGLYPSKTLTPSSDSIAVSRKLKDYVVLKLSQLGFNNPEKNLHGGFSINHKNKDPD